MTPNAHPTKSEKKHSRRMPLFLCLGFCLVAGSWFGFREYQGRRLARVKDLVAESFATRNWNQALTATGEWTSLAPDDGEAWARYANVLAELDRHQEAYNALLNVSSEYLRYPDILELRANILIRELDDPLECMAVCEELLTIEPASPAAHHFLVYIRLLLKDPEQLASALNDAMTAGAETPPMYAYLMLIDRLTIDDGLEVTSNWLKKHPTEQAIQAANAAFQFEFAQREKIKSPSNETRKALATSVKNLQTLRESDQENAVILETLLERAVTAGDVSQVKSLLNKCPNQHRTRIAVERAYGWILLQENENEKASQVFRSLLLRRPLSFTTRGMLSDALRTMGNLEEAETEATIAANGAKIDETIRRLTSFDEVSPALLRSIHTYATSCKDWFTVNALSRRLGQTKSP